jgi:3-methyladenine DNA glycosylase AlkD
MDKILDNLRKELKANSDVKTKNSGERFFREEVILYGIKSSTVGKIAKEFFKKISDEDKSYVFSICEELWKSGIMEESFIACNWSHYIWKKYKPEDFFVFNKWLNSYVSNWASCDTFCNHTVGTFIEEYPSYINELKKWAHSDNRWVKRGSAVSLIVPARKGLFLDDIFEIADILHSDNDDMVQKGYGWMLKVASQTHKEEVFNYVMKKKLTMPRTALRYAIEKMPKELKTAAMAK